MVLNCAPVIVEASFVTARKHGDLPKTGLPTVNTVHLKSLPSLPRETLGPPSSLLDGLLPEFEPGILEISDSAGSVNNSRNKIVKPLNHP